jgi:hypothetical protein
MLCVYSHTCEHRHAIATSMQVINVMMAGTWDFAVIGAPGGFELFRLRGAIAPASCLDLAG